jgi:hypothetical protein
MRLRDLRSHRRRFILFVSDAEQPVSASVAPDESLDAVVLDAEVQVKVWVVGELAELLLVVRLQRVVHCILRGGGRYGATPRRRRDLIGRRKAHEPVGRRWLTLMGVDGAAASHRGARRPLSSAKGRRDSTPTRWGESG